MPRNLGAYDDNNSVARKIDVDRILPKIIGPDGLIDLDLMPASARYIYRMESFGEAPMYYSDGTIYYDTHDKCLLQYDASISSWRALLPWPTVLYLYLDGDTPYYYRAAIGYDGEIIMTLVASRLSDAWAHILALENILATPTDAGLMSAADKTKLDGISGSGVVLDYTTMEQDTGSKWIDGKTIYRKVIVKTGGLPTAAGNTTIAHGILYDGANDIDTVVSLSGEGYLATNDMWLPLPYMSASANQSIAIRTNNRDIEFVVGMNRSGVTPCYVTIEYTRASDPAP